MEKLNFAWPLVVAIESILQVKSCEWLKYKKPKKMEIYLIRVGIYLNSRVYVVAKPLYNIFIIF